MGALWVWGLLGPRVEALSCLESLIWPDGCVAEKGGHQQLRGAVLPPVSGRGEMTGIA